MTALVIVMLPLLLSLGNWQVQRGAFKRDLESQYLEKLTELPKPVSVDVMSQPFQALKLNGRYQPETFLVDNQVSKGKTGYWVFQVFDEASIGRVLINRGFIASETRDRLPQIPMPEETVGVRGDCVARIGAHSGMGTTRVVERLAKTYSAGEYPAYGSRGGGMACGASFRGRSTWRVRACTFCLALIRRYT